MLISSCAENRSLAQQNLPSFEDVREHHRIEMANMGGYCAISREQVEVRNSWEGASTGVDVEYGCGDVVWFVRVRSGTRRVPSLEMRRAPTPQKRPSGI